MSRWVPWLAELQPGGFAELATELAAELGIENGDWVTLATARGAVETRALVTDRLRALTIDGRQLHQVGMPWHYGYEGLATGAVANDLSALVEDPDSFIHEAKSFTCALVPGRRAAEMQASDQPDGGQRG
jgi:formate dehydrogenase major subunit